MRRRLQVEIPRCEERMYSSQMTVDHRIFIAIAVAIAAVDDKVHILSHIDHKIWRRADTHPLIGDDDREYIADLRVAIFIGVLEANRIRPIRKRTRVEGTQ